MKVGDLVKLKPSVLETEGGVIIEKPLGVVISRHLNAVKVHWFSVGTTILPDRSQYVLKLQVVSEL